MKKNISNFVILNGNKFKISVQKKNLIKHQNSNILADTFGSKKLKNLDWYYKGYKVLDVFSIDEHLENKENINYNLKKILNLSHDNSFDVTKYHKYVNNKSHIDVIEKTRELNPKIFDKITRKIFSKIYKEYKISFKKNNILRKEIAILRLNRPTGIKDINPPHRDGYLDYWSKCLNIWYMISGTFSSCALPIIPKSHLIKEKDLILTKPYSVMNGVKYHVPTIIKIANQKYIKLSIPRIRPGQVLIFSPYLIHGFGFNFSNYNTRSALEFRPEII